MTVPTRGRQSVRGAGPTPYAIVLPARLALGRMTVFIHSNIVHSPAEKGLPERGCLLGRNRINYHG